VKINTGGTYARSTLSCLKFRPGSFVQEISPPDVSGGSAPEPPALLPGSDRSNMEVITPDACLLEANGRDHACCVVASACRLGRCHLTSAGSKAFRSVNSRSKLLSAVSAALPVIASGWVMRNFDGS
jgi:hypothetical protein